MMGPGVLLPLPCWSRFLHFLYTVDIHPYVLWYGWILYLTSYICSRTYMHINIHMSPTRHGGCSDYTDPCLLRSSKRWQMLTGLVSRVDCLTHCEPPPPESGYVLPGWAVKGHSHSDHVGLTAECPGVESISVLLIYSSNQVAFCFVVALHHSNSISIISWWWYDIWDEEEKAWAYTFTNWRDPTRYRHGMRGTGLWWCCKLDKWIAAQLNVMTQDSYPCPQGQ